MLIKASESLNCEFPFLSADLATGLVIGSPASDKKGCIIHFSEMGPSL